MKLAILILVPWVGGILTSVLLYPHIAALPMLPRILVAWLAHGIVSFAVTGIILYLLLCSEIRTETEGTTEPTKPTSTYE